MKKRIYKVLINWYQASDKDLPQWLEEACARDTDLKTELSFGDELTQALKKSPNGMEALESDSMAARVLSKITEEDYLAEQELERRPIWGVWARNAGMVAAAFAIALVAYQTLNTESTSPEGDPTVAVANIGAATDGLLEGVSEDWKNPLDQEIEYIVADAKGALGFLASTFVPSSYLEDEA